MRERASFAYPNVPIEGDSVSHQVFREWRFDAWLGAPLTFKRERVDLNARRAPSLWLASVPLFCVSIIQNSENKTRYNLSAKRSMMSTTSILLFTCFFPASRFATQNGQVVARTSAPVASADLTRSPAIFFDSSES